MSYGSITVPWSDLISEPPSRETVNQRREWHRIWERRQEEEAATSEYAARVTAQQRYFNRWLARQIELERRNISWFKTPEKARSNYYSGSDEEIRERVQG